MGLEIFIALLNNFTSTATVFGYITSVSAISSATTEIADNSYDS